MLINHFKIAFRNLKNQKAHAIINILGLAIGLACSVLILLFVRQETSYDAFHENADRLYRVTYEEVNTPAMRHLATVSPPMGPALMQEYPEVVNFARFRFPDRSIFARGNTRFYESRFLYADSTFFDLFTFPLAQGNPETALQAANSIVVTPAIARKYFGDTDPMGKTLTMNEEELTVTGVLQPLPAETHLPFDFLVSFTTFRVPRGYPVTLDSWGWISFPTYVLLAEDADASDLEARLPEFLLAHFDEERAANARLRLQPVPSIYLGDPKHVQMSSGSLSYIYGLSAVGLLILLLAGFNFANLSTVHAVRRAKEVSVRKVLGAQRAQLAKQFLSESVLVALISFMMALVVVKGFAESSDALFGWKLSLGWADYLLIVPIFLGITVLVGALAGTYPALILSRFQPVKVLKGEHDAGRTGGTFRGILIVLQFAIAIALIVGSLTITRQMDFIRTKDLGFDREQVVTLHMPGTDLRQHYPALRNQLLQNPNVINVTTGGHLFDGDQGSVPIFPQGADEDAARAMSIYSLDFDFVETLGLNVIKGRAPSRAFPMDSSNAIMLNRAAADVFAATIPGWDDPIGKNVRVDEIREGQVIGVVEDFHFASLHSSIDPLVLFFPRSDVDKVFVRINPGNIPNLLAALEQQWKATVPELPFSYSFLDDHIQQIYKDDQRFSRLLSVFSLLTILVACLGLYGLVAFVTELRTKEIGIRKVLGASVPGMVSLLSRQFVLYVVLANLIAWPLAYFGMRRWLNDFAYHVDVVWWIFLLAGVATLVLALLTISYHTLRVATADPVKSLRYE